MKAMYKFEVAQAAGVSRTTFRSWIRRIIAENNPAFSDYNKYGKLLSGDQVEALSKRFCIIFD